MRQADILTEYDPKPGVSISTLAYEYPRGFQVPEHAHGSDQLIYAIRGVMEVYAGQSVWLMPPHFALWIPARTRHRLNMPGPVSMRTLYLRPRIVPTFTGCAVLHVTPLLRELIVETVRLGHLRTRIHHERALRDVLALHIEKASPMPTGITLPKEQRARAVANALLANPADPKPLVALCSEAGVSVRTIERAFQKDVGTDFARWKRQVRLMKAVELMVSGCSIKEVAFAIGYRQPSAFVEMFRQTFGTTPKSWISGLEKLSR